MQETSQEQNRVELLNITTHKTRINDYKNQIKEMGSISGGGERCGC